MGCASHMASRPVPGAADTSLVFCPSQVKEQCGLRRPRFLLKKRLSRAFLHQPLLADMLEVPLDLPVHALRGCSRQTAQTAGTGGASLAWRGWFLALQFFS